MSVTLASDDLYERLGVAREASGDEVKRAYRSLVRVYPPERAPEEFKRIRMAYETLSDPRSRQEYDTAPDPGLQRLMHAAAQAMNVQDWTEAERNLKQILVQDPSIDYVRNMLGLCFVYQGKAVEAVQQYERLLAAPDPAPAWLGNAGHAYRMLHRFADARTVLQRAIDTAKDGETVTYQLGLVDVFLDQNDYRRAVKFLEEAIRSDGKVDFDDLLFFTKLVEVHLRQNDVKKVRAVVKRILAIPFDEEQRKYAAWKLGSLGRELLHSGAFEFAQVVAEGAAAVEPGNRDYPALADLAHRLEEYDYEGAMRVVGHHPSFKEGEWMAQMGPAVHQFCSDRRALSGMKRLHRPPSMYTLNTVGTRLYGERDHDRFTQSYVATLYFVVFFIPLFPIRCYRVVPQDGGWCFLGQVEWSDRERLHLKVFLGVLAALVIWGLITA